MDEAEVTIRVTVSETLGADTLVHGHLHSDEDGRTAVTARVPGKFLVDDGDLCPFRIKADGLHLFDSKTEQRIDA